MRRIGHVSFLLVVASVLVGCPQKQATQEYNAGRKAEAAHDFDSALEHYNKALKIDPQQAEYKIRAEQMRFEAAQNHVEQGQRALKTGDFQLALAEFQKARAMDPSNSAAEQGAQQAAALLNQQQKANQPQTVNPNPPNDEDLMSGPPQLKPVSLEPINLKMTNDSRVIFETIGKLAGLSVIFDPDYQSRRITADLPNVTLEEALDAVCIESKAFWKPVTPSIILVASDQPQKRKDYEDEVVRTFYLSNTLTPQDLTEIVTGLRQLLDLHRLQQVNSQNAIVVRDTPDKLILAAKIIRDIDKAKPEVLLHVQVLQADLDKVRQLGVLPGQSATLTFNPRTSIQPNSTTSTTSTTTTTTTTSSTSSTPLVTLNNLKHLSSADYSLTLPGAAVQAVLTDTDTRIIQDPEIRVSDGEDAKLKIGDKIPVATGSFQAGVGVGATGGAGVINPLVNTQFQYLDVGVNIDVTPRVHPDGEVSMKVKIEVSSETGTTNIGGIDQPIISQRTVEHEIRLKEGEVSVLGGLLEHDVTNSVNGWPGLAKLPFFKYFFSQTNTEVQDRDVLIVLTPHILRLPSITQDDLRSLAAGTDTNVRVYREEYGQPESSSPPMNPPINPAPRGGVSTPAAPASAPGFGADPGGSAQLRFDPTDVTMKAGETETVALAVTDVRDLFSIPLLVQYNPSVIQIEEARNGGFLSGGSQEIAIVQHVDQQKGEAIISASRQPNTPGVNGNGTILGLVVKAVGPGTSTIQIVQVNARNSQQKQIPLVSGVETVKVQ